MSKEFCNDNNQESSEYYSQPWFMAGDPDSIFGVKRPGDVTTEEVIRQLEAENKLSGPYSRNLVYRLGKIVQIVRLYTRMSKSPESPSDAERWFNDHFGHLIRNEKLQGMQPPETPPSPRPKGFWSTLFG